MRYFSNQQGDTIVEVMICIALMGAVLAGAYATANNSLASVRDSQDREQAIQLAQSQLEVLDTETLSSLPNVPFCFDSSQTPQPTTDTSACSISGPQDYQIVITPPTSVLAAGNLPTYAITITWDGLNGATDRVAMFYQPIGAG